MAVAVNPPPAAAALAHPAFDPLRPWLDRLGRADGTWPGVDALNRLAAASARPPVTASGRPVHFCLPDPSSPTSYEQRVFDTGQVATRPENLHDLFNALTWLALPCTKAALNARHVAQMPHDGARRGPLRDLLTLIDEGGVIVACAEGGLPQVEALIRGSRWQALFWEARAQVLRDVRFVLIGHSAYEKALAPYPGITCKALLVATPPGRMDAPFADLVCWLDGEAATWIAALAQAATPRQMAPLPVFGYPGWLVASDRCEFYADTRWFRPGPAALSRGTAPKLGRAA